MTLLTRLFGRSSGDDAQPWTDQSAYRTIKANVDPSSGRLLGETRLPDEPNADDGRAFRWAPGAMDGVLGHHSNPESNSAASLRLAKLIDRIARTGDRRSIADAYAMMKDESALGMIDSVVEKLSKLNSPIEPHLNDFALRLARDSRDRGPVKIGLALLGAAGLAQHREIVETLGLHDEFTLFAAVALRNLLKDSEAALWQLACKVDGWGRIQIVERLVPISDPAIRHWLRTEGFRNSVMYEYLALTAAEHGKLREGLDRINVTASELVAASELIVAMINADHGPCAGMNFYTDAAATSLLYLGHVKRAPLDLHHHAAVHAIHDYVVNDTRAVDEKLANGWSETAIDEAKRSSREIAENEVWEELIREQLGSADPDTLHRAATAAVIAQIDPFPWHWERLKTTPHDRTAWHFVMRHANADRIPSILEFAENHLPLAELATGPAEETGLGPSFALHGCLDSVLQELKSFPGHGSRLIAAGLMSPVVRNRHMAINALEAWDREQWMHEMRDALARAREREPDEEVAKRLGALPG